MGKNHTVRFIVISSFLHLSLLLLFLFSYGGERGAIGAEGLVSVTLTSNILFSSPPQPSPAKGEGVIFNSSTPILGGAGVVSLRGEKFVSEEVKGAEAVADNNLDLSKQLSPKKDAGVSAGGEPTADSDILISGDGSGAAGAGIIIYHKPSYPIISRIRGEAGRVRLAAGIKVDGLVETVRIEESSGYERLDQAAVKALYKFRFAPSLLVAGNLPEVKKVSFLFALEE